MTEERTEEARAAGLLHLTIGGSPVDLPVLRIRKARDWKRRLGEVDVDGSSSDLEYPIDVMLDLLVAYDVTGALGSRESLEDRATDREVYDAFKEVLAASFPFVKDAETMMTEDFARLVSVVMLERARSTNGRSANGVSIPTPSRKRSPKSSSSSSGTRAASA